MVATTSFNRTMTITNCLLVEYSRWFWQKCNRFAQSRNAGNRSTFPSLIFSETDLAVHLTTGRSECHSVLQSADSRFSSGDGVIRTWIQSWLQYIHRKWIWPKKYSRRLPSNALDQFLRFATTFFTLLTTGSKMCNWQQDGIWIQQIRF
jgi:hypothetical protein